MDFVDSVETLTRPNKALQRTRISAGCHSWRSVHAADLGR
jgi:hypothetical protein